MKPVWEELHWSNGQSVAPMASHDCSSAVTCHLLGALLPFFHSIGLFERRKWKHLPKSGTRLQAAQPFTDQKTFAKLCLTGQTVPDGAKQCPMGHIVPDGPHSARWAIQCPMGNTVPDRVHRCSTVPSSAHKCPTDAQQPNTAYLSFSNLFSYFSYAYIWSNPFSNSESQT